MAELYPLTHPQKRIWHVERLHPGTGMWNNAGTLKIKGQLDFDLLERAIQIFVERNESIRLRVCLIDGQPMQYVAPFHPTHIDILDFTESGLDGLYAWDTIQTQAPLSLIDSDLFYFAFAKTAPDEGYVYAKIHHLISDGVSFVIFANEVLDTYDRLLSNRELQEEHPHSYLNYLKDEESYIASKRFGYDEEYWLSRFSDAPEPSQLKQKKPGYTGTRARRKACVVPLKLSNDIRAYCHENKISVFSLLLAALAIYLNRTQGKDDIVVSAPVSNRTSSSAAMYFGMYVSTVPVRITIDNETSFKDFAFGVSNDWFSVLKHQKYPYDMLIKKIRKIRNDVDMLYDITLSYQIGTFEKNKENFSYEGRWHFSGQQENSINIHWNDREGNGKFVLDYDHLVPLFSVKEIDFLHTHLLNIIADAIAHPEKKLHEIDLLSADEYRKVTAEFNGVDSREEHRSLLSLWEERVSETPDAQALVFHNNRISVRDLDKRSTALARRLVSLGIQADEAVALMLPRSDSYIVAMLGILKAGGAFLPVDLAWPQERIDFMLADCSVRFAICEQPSRVPQGVQIVDWRAPHTHGTLPEVSPHSLAYLIYTSGSTGQPKGVMIEHHSIAHFAQAMRGLWSTPLEGRMLCAGPTSFDLSVMEIVIGLLGNNTLVIADEGCASFPKQLCALIREHNINKMMVTPGRMELLLGSPEGETVLRGFEKIGLGADVLTPSLLARVQAHTNAQIVNYYGPTEVTVCATCCDVTDVREANIGRPLPDVQAYILDGHLNPVPIGVPGELYVGGAGLARGYVGKEDLTQARFISSPFVPGERLYRTGDLCRWYPRGEILFLGRIDQQVKIRGYRIELGEIENKLLDIEGIQSCAVICREDIEGRKSLCAYVVGDTLPSASKIKALLSKDLPSYMVPSYFVALPLLPLTSNDKLDKKSLPAPQDAEGLLREEFEPPITDTEEGLALIWETILGIGEVGRNGNFFDLGGDSLSVVQMAAEVAEKFNVSLSLEEVYRTPFLDSCAALIDAAESNHRKPIRPASSRRNYPASSLQRRMFILAKQNPESVAYNIPMSFAFDHTVDENRLRSALDRLVKRHSILRTSLKLHNNAIVQNVQKSAVLDFQSLTCKESRLDATLKSLIRPFDIEQCPLVHSALIKTPKRHVLFLDFHHSLCDQATMRILLDDLAMLYSGSEPPSPSLDYKDCAVWLDEYLLSEAMQKQGDFWREQFSGDLPPLDLFTEKKRTGAMRGGVCKGSIDAKTVSRIRAFAKQEGGTFFTAMMTAFSVLLSKQSGQDELIVGTPVSGRTHAQMQSVVGAFINTLPIICKPDAMQSVRDYFASTSETLTRALDNQDYPFDRIVTDCGARREADRNPLFDVMLVLGKDDLDLRLSDGSAKARAIDTSTAKLDISLYLYEHEGGLECYLEYDRDLFSPATARRILDRFIHTVETMFLQPDIALKDICVLPDDEYELVTQRFSATEEPYAERPLHEWIEDLALSRPNDIAVVSGGKRITFDELNKRANRIAHSLIDQGAGAGSVVALMMQRGIDLMPALFGIMKTGAAYLPVDPAYPEGRVAFMLNDSCVKITPSRR